MSLQDLTNLVFYNNHEKSGQCLIALSTGCGSFGQMFTSQNLEVFKKCFCLTLSSVKCTCTCISHITLKHQEILPHMLIEVCAITVSDCRKGFWHQQPDEASSFLITFNTELSRFHYTVMPFELQ